MDFSFTESQQAIQDTTRWFAAAEVAPGYAEREKLGGLGSDSVTAGIVIEEISRADISVGYVQLLGSLNGSVLADHARAEVADDLVSAICRGDIVVALGLTEPRGGSDAAHLVFRADRTDGEYLLTGEKTSISMAESTDWAIIFARTDTSQSGAAGRGSDHAAGGKVAVLQDALVKRSGNAAHQRGCHVQMVGTESGIRCHSSMSAVAWARWL